MLTSQKYKVNFFAFMSFLDGTNYSPLDDNITFSQEHIVLITDTHVASFLLYKAYGDGYDPNPQADQDPIMRSATIAFYKKAISTFMTRQRQQWDDITQRGNPTKLAVVHMVIKNLKKREVRGMGVPPSARRAVDWDEFMCLLVGTCLVFPSHDVMLPMLAGLTLQWQIIGRIDDVIQLAMSTILKNSRYPFTLHIKMCVSTNIVCENQSPMQMLFGGMDPLVCPLLNLAVYLKVRHPLL